MTELYEIVKQTADDGTVLDVETRRTWVLPVVSTDVIPKGCPIYTQAYIVDKLNVAICDGKDNWYGNNSSGRIVSASAGQTWEVF